MRNCGVLCAVVLLASLLGATPAQAQDRCPVELDQTAHGSAAITALGDDLAEVAIRAALSPATLRSELRTDRTLWLDECARPYYVEPAPAHERLFEPALTATGDVLTLHSRPGSKRTIYLDFDGFTVTDSSWARTYGQFTAPAYSLDSDPTFNDTEKARIADVWLRVSEDYAAFDVDVTTEEPLDSAIDRTSAADLVFGTRVAIVGSNPIYTSCNCGGIAYLDAFDATQGHADEQPAFVFAVRNAGTGSKFISEAATHEVGHNLSLLHDGATPGTTYYSGQGLWAPIMGVGYYQPLTQWSKGEYTGANNREDDLADIHSHGASVMADDAGDDAGTAERVTPGTTSGLISTNTDTDWFTFDASGGTSLTVEPQDVSPDLDARLDLYDDAGTLLASDDLPATKTDVDTAGNLSAHIEQVLPDGTYYVAVQGVGSGSPATTGYSDYASLGRYDLSLATGGPAVTTVTRQALAPTTQGSPISAVFTATGGTPPYRFEATDLPTGLTLSGTGTLGGSVSTPGTYLFDVTAADSTSQTGHATYGLLVAPKPAPVTPPVTPTPTPAPGTPTPTPTPTPATTTTPTPTAVSTPILTISTSGALPRARVGRHYDRRLRADSAATWQVSAGTPPKGIRLTVTGRVTGKPVRAGRYRFTVTATGSIGQTATATFTIQVRRAKR